MKYLTALGLIAFVWVNAEIADSVSQYQLDATYACAIDGAVCRGYGFGHLQLQPYVITD